MTDAPKIYAHSNLGRPWSEWETLDAHAGHVARLARLFAAEFGAGDWGELLGRWHDLGKCSDEFQAYLRATSDPDAGENEDTPGVPGAPGVPGRVDHSTFGARYAAQAVGKHFGQLLALCIAGHHGNLPDATTDDAAHERSTLAYRLNEKTIPSVRVPPEEKSLLALKLPFITDRSNAGFQIAFFTRMLFSALIDADRTATEQFCDPTQATQRKCAKPTIGQLRVALDDFMIKKQANAERTPVNGLRTQILTDCLASAPLAPGFFSLNVPTGGGKTYASLAFALHHAETHNLRRVVVAIPFTSIIEQTADAYGEALGPLATRGLVEHHSNIDPKKETRHNKLAAENWDAPIIVTTNVQLYESLFAAATTPCRKLHRLARSVIVLDEAQTIPVELLQPTLLALKELVAHYHCTIVLCTATQPALEQREEFKIGIENVRPIIRDAQALFTALRRVEVVRLGVLTDEELVKRLAEEPAALCIVNTRPHASELYDTLVARCGKDGCYHLSTFMCAQHRRDKLVQVRQRLKHRQPCRLIATQLIEAGVDVDFPAVFRAPTGFDSIAQAAGRCNREGLLRLGRVYLFDTLTPPPPGLQRASADCARELINRHPDPIAPGAIEAYFRLFYWLQQHQSDKFNVLGALDDDFKNEQLRLKFRLAASRYRIIRDEQTPILVPYDADARAIRNRLMRGEPTDFLLLRSAQRYLVSVRENWLSHLSENQVICQHESGLWWLANERAYSPEKGLSLESVGFDPAILHG